MSKTRVVHCKKEPYDVYIGRSKHPDAIDWGNPFSHKAGTLAKFKVATREEAIAEHRKWVVQQPTLMLHLRQLKGKTLGCWCKPLACHGDTLAELADSLE